MTPDPGNLTGIFFAPESPRRFGRDKPEEDLKFQFVINPFLRLREAATAEQGRGKGARQYFSGMMIALLPIWLKV